MSLEETDKTGQAAADKGGGFRISLEYIKSEIAQVYYISGNAIRQHADLAEHIDKQFPRSDLGVMTLCMLVMRSGWVVFGKSSPLSPENFNPEVGQKFAYEDAVRQLWPLFAFGYKQAEADGMLSE